MIAFFALAALAVMLLWNAILPEVVGVKPLNYWQSAGLLLLCRILFGHFPGARWQKDHGRRNASSHRREWRQKWMTMSEEERAAFRDKWRERCQKRDAE
jgi:hypothetical protein